MIAPFFVLLVARLMFWRVGGKKEPDRRKEKLSNSMKMPVLNSSLSFKFELGNLVSQWVTGLLLPRI